MHISSRGTVGEVDHSYRAHRRVEIGLLPSSRQHLGQEVEGMVAVNDAGVDVELVERVADGLFGQVYGCVVLRYRLEGPRRSV